MKMKKSPSILEERLARKDGGWVPLDSAGKVLISYYYRIFPSIVAFTKDILVARTVVRVFVGILVKPSR